MQIKTQTKRSTKMQEVTNINCFVENNFSLAFLTSSYWGDFSKCKDIKVEIESNGKIYFLPLSEFKKVIEKNLGDWESKANEIN
jgi:hypothetical protein